MWNRQNHSTMKQLKYCWERTRGNVFARFLQKKIYKKNCVVFNGKIWRISKEWKKKGWIGFFRVRKRFFFAGSAWLPIPIWTLKIDIYDYLILCLNCGWSRVNRSSNPYLFPFSLRLHFNNLIAFIIFCNGWLHLPNECFIK